MSSDSEEDAALAALLQESVVSEDADDLGLISRGSTVTTPLRSLPKREPGGGALLAAAVRNLVRSIVFVCCRKVNRIV